MKPRPPRADRHPELDDRPRPSAWMGAGLDPTALVRVPASAGVETEAPPEPFPCPFCGHRLTVEVGRCPSCFARAVPPVATDMGELATRTKWVYALQGLFLLGGSGAIPGLVLLYLNRRRARNTWLDSHCEWQMDTFWGMFWMGMVIMFLATIVYLEAPPAAVRAVLGTVAFAAYSGWFINRVVKGWMRLSDGEPMTEY